MMSSRQTNCQDRKARKDASASSKSRSLLRGMDHLTDARLNKGLAFTIEERQLLGIHGFLPPVVRSQEDQVRICKADLDKYSDDLQKYVYLAELQCTNERLFYRLLAEHTEEMMPLVYTPTVGLACQKYGEIFHRPRGMFIAIHDKGHVQDVINSWPESNVTAIVVTDGERILGLGDLGANGMGIPVGKLALYTALAGVKPDQCLPITLDVGTNNQSLLDNPTYIGLKHRRVEGPEYDEFIDEFMQAVVKRYGPNTLIQFEDFGNKNASRLLEKYQNKYCTFNDDIQGTASVAAAGFLASLRLTSTKLTDHVFLFLGAGEAALGIAQLVVRAMVKQGLPESEANAKMWLVDSKGLIVKSRTDKMSHEKLQFAQDGPQTDSFLEAVRYVKPTAIIGASAQSGAFTKEILTLMGEINESPIIFALSNPTSKAECTAEQAYTCTDGRAIFASGSPFPPFQYKGKTFIPGQGNNAYIFPGVSLGVIVAGIRHISNDVFLRAAETLANLVTEKDLQVGRLYPPQAAIFNASLVIAKVVVEDAYRNGTASVFPEPKDKEQFIKAHIYDYNYSSSLPALYQWPKF